MRQHISIVIDKTTTDTDCTFVFVNNDNDKLSGK
jgi:hypothetical protein